MRRRILGTVVLVTALAVTLLFVPAALAIRSRDLTEQEVEAQRDAAIAVAAIAPGDPQRDPLPVDDEYGLYDTDGRLVHGRGPARAEAAVREAFAGEPTLAVDGEQVVAGLAIDGTQPALVLRVAEPRDEARSATVRSIASLGAGALLIVVGAIAAAWILASRLARPVETLGKTAARLDDGDFTATAGPSGITEIDQVASTLTRTGERIHRTIERERAFSADASHQLRTPLAAMRTAVEAEQLDPRGGGIILSEVLSQIERMDETLTSLLALARDTPDDRRPIDLAALVGGAARRWSPSFEAVGRRLEVALPATPPRPSVSHSALDHVLDVLLDNARRHGTGSVTLQVDAIDTAARIVVTDEGHVQADPRQMFGRRPDGAAGIGLHLARSLIEAEGGRLRLAADEPTAFEITLPLGRISTFNTSR